jgi:hypothetical protein
MEGIQQSGTTPAKGWFNWRSAAIWVLTAIVVPMAAASYAYSFRAGELWNQVSRNAEAVKEIKDDRAHLATAREVALEMGRLQAEINSLRNELKSYQEQNRQLQDLQTELIKALHTRPK